MDYSVFERMGEPCYLLQKGETNQQHLERILRASFEDGPGSNPPRINDMMQGTFVSCDVEKRTLTIRFHVAEWMRNPYDALHGGMASTAIDMTMGLLSRYYRQLRKVVTTNLNVNFMRGIPCGVDFEVCATVDKLGERMIFTRAEMRRCDTGDVAVEAMASFV